MRYAIAYHEANGKGFSKTEPYIHDEFINDSKEECLKVASKMVNDGYCLVTPFIIDDKNEVVSNIAKFIANSASDDENTRIFKFRFTLNNIQFDRNKPYYLILKDADKDDEYIEKEQITLDIIQFKMF